MKMPIHPAYGHVRKRGFCILTKMDLLSIRAVDSLPASRRAYYTRAYPCCGGAVLIGCPDQTDNLQVSEHQYAVD
jgi:hypothetical protein